MKSTRRPRILSHGLAVMSVVFVTATTGLACQYCQLAADPEAYRFMTDRPANGVFPLDSATGSYSSSDTATPPTPAQLITDASALQTPAATHPGATVSAVATPRRPLVPASNTATVATASSLRHLATSAHWADIGLVALVGALGWFAWRTRRSQNDGESSATSVVAAAAFRPS